jgi:hypothetical protein
MDCKDKIKAERDRLLERLTEVLAPLDAGYFRLDFAQFLGRPMHETDALSREWSSYFSDRAFGRLVSSMIATLPIRIAHPLDDAYFEPFAAYYMACFSAVRRDFDKAAYYAGLIDFDAPPDGTDLLPYDIRQATRLLAYRQQYAIARGIPSIIIISMPKSASAFLSNTIAQVLDAPVLRLSVGEGLESFPVPKWVQQTARGGAITHEHIEALPSQLETLRRSGLEGIWVQIRDPRDVAYSLLMMTRLMARPINSSPEEFFLKYTERLARWLDGWIAASESADQSLRIRFVTFEDVTRNLESTVLRMLDGRMTSEIGERLRLFAAQPSLAPNFRNGRGGEWRDVFETVRKEAWKSIPDRVTSLLALEP